MLKHKSRSLLITVIIIFCTIVTLNANPYEKNCQFGDQPFAIEELTTLIRNPECNVKNISDVIAVLPERMKSKFVLFYRSQSLQGPHRKDFIYPRAILSSVRDSSNPSKMEKALMVSFNGHELQPGFNRLEIVDINPGLNSPDIFNYYEISFPKEGTTTAMTWEQIQSQIKISNPNPTLCIQCHGSPARPIFQQYPQWPGVFGSRHTDPMTQEEEEGLSAFVKAHKDSHASCYWHLNPSRFLLGGDSRRLEYNEGTTSDSNSPISFDSGRLALAMTVDLSNYNGVRMARKIKSMPMYAYFRYAIVAALEDCSSFSNFLPQALLKDLEDRLERRFNLSKIDPNLERDIFSKIQEAGYSQFGRYPEVGGSIEATIKNHRSAFDNDPNLFALWVDTMNKQGFDRIATQAAKLRLIFEGLGYNMDTWWMDLKQPTYRFNSGFGQNWSRFLYEVDPNLKQLFEASGIENARSSGDYESLRLLQKNFCQTLEKKSREVLTSVDFYRFVSNKSVDPLLNSTFPRVFETTCRSCHSDLSIGPRIPFDSEKDMAAWLVQGTHLERIKYKVLEAPEVESMPPTRVLTNEEREQIINYLKTFQN